MESACSLTRGAKYYWALAQSLCAQGKLDSAIAAYGISLVLDPSNSSLHAELAFAMKRNGDILSAFESYKTAITLDPGNAIAFNNLGNILREMGDIDGASISYKAALSLDKGHAQVYNNFGLCLMEAGYLEKAMALFEEALRIKSYYPNAQFNLALARLLSNDYRSGLVQYEWRFKKGSKSLTTHAMPRCKRWDGKKLAKTDKLLVVTEQGLGDTLQFMRYVIELRNMGVKVSLCAQPKLHSLISSSGIDSCPLEPEQANQVVDGYWIPLLSVPRFLNVSPENPLIRHPYIKPKHEFTRQWEKLFSIEKRPIIGINWQGNPDSEKSSLRGRSIALEEFAPLASHQKVCFLSLQKGSGSDQMKSCSFKHRFVAFQDQVDRQLCFLQAASIIKNTELVITCDSVVAHLAAGMGHPTWLLLHFSPDWRWGLDSSESFWYPSMRLFRQKERGNWHEVMERVLRALYENFHIS